MGRAKFKIPGLILLFLISLAVWFRLSPKGGAETAGVTYTVLSEPRIPVLWAETCGRKMDVMHGYLTDTDADIAADAEVFENIVFDYFLTSQAPADEAVSEAEEALSEAAEEVTEGAESEGVAE